MKTNSVLGKYVGSFKGMAWFIVMVSFMVAFIVPLPGFVIDLCLVTSMSIAVVIYLRSLSIGEWNELKTFPSILLILTTFRIALNISTTRKILEDGEPGQVIKMFGEFVIGSNLVIGVVIFLVMIVLQFIIASGASRTAEVAARFTLDSIPMKSMSVDAELSQGMITQEEATEKRKQIELQKDFFGAMDGAGRFIKGDVWIGVVLIVVNIVAGLCIGMMYKGMSIGDAAYKYTLLTIGDGIVNQLSSFIISVSSGIVMTRVYDGNKEDVGRGIFNELTFNPVVLQVVALVMFALGIATGTILPFAIIGITLLMISRFKRKEQKEKEEKEKVVQIEEEEQRRQEMKKQQDLDVVTTVDAITLEVGMALLPLVDNEEGKESIAGRVPIIRKVLGAELGVNIPDIRVRDNIGLSPYNSYRIKIKDKIVAEGEIQLNALLALKTLNVREEIDGRPTKEPIYGSDAVWISEVDGQRAKQMGYVIQDGLGIISLHIEEVVRQNLHELFTRQEVKNLLDKVEIQNKVLITEIEKKNISYSIIQGVLKNLLRENIPLRDLPTILEAIIDASEYFKDTDNITTIVREKVSNYICQNSKNSDGKMYLITLDNELEERMETIMRHDGFYLKLSILEEEAIYDSFMKQYKRAQVAGIDPTLFVYQSNIRFGLMRMMRNRKNVTPVITRNELEPDVELEHIGTISIAENAQQSS